MILKRGVMDDQQGMKRAVDKAKEGIANGQTPFGSCLVKERRVICVAHNQVWQDTDITAHAEIVAIREACRQLGTVDLSGCTLYATCEPCPMCFSACHWANISRLVFGARITDARKSGFNELTISTRKMKESGKSRLLIAGDVLRPENLELFALWAAREDKRVY